MLRTVKARQTSDRPKTNPRPPSSDRIAPASVLNMRRKSCGVSGRTESGGSHRQEVDADRDVSRVSSIARRVTPYLTAKVQLVTHLSREAVGRCTLAAEGRRKPQGRMAVRDTGSAAACRLRMPRCGAAGRVSRVGTTPCTRRTYPSPEPQRERRSGRQPGSSRLCIRSERDASLALPASRQPIHDKNGALQVSALIEGLTFQD